MRCLELFKGSGSITKFYENNENMEVISLDILKKYNPTILTDIMDWDYKQYPVEHFDIIWASPECKIFSMLQNSWVGRKYKDMNELNEIRKSHSKFINKTIEIIEYFKPKYYFIENPLHSKIWDFVENKKYLEKYVNVCYCYFGYDYKKPTKILTNKSLKNKPCLCVGKPKHKICLGITSQKGMKAKGLEHPDRTSLKQRYSIPQKLLEYLLLL